MRRRRCPKQAPVQSAVLNYLRTAAWRGVGPVPAEWLLYYLYGQDTPATRLRLGVAVRCLRRRGFPIAVLRKFAYEFRPAADQPKWPELWRTSVTINPAMPQISAPAQQRTSHQSERTEEIARSAVVAAVSAEDLMLP